MPYFGRTYPAEFGYPIVLVNLPVFKEVHQQVLLGLVKRHLIDIAKEVELLRILGINVVEFSDFVLELSKLCDYSKKFTEIVPLTPQKISERGESGNC